MIRRIPRKLAKRKVIPFPIPVGRPPVEDMLKARYAELRELLGLDETPPERRLI